MKFYKGDLVALKPEILIDCNPEGREDNRTGVVCTLRSDGCVQLDRDLGVTQYWNVDDLEKVEKAKLSEEQFEIMSLMRRGRQAFQSGDNPEVEIEGQKVCSLSLMQSLQKIGLVEKVDHDYWAATRAGKMIALFSPTEFFPLNE